MAYTNIDFPSGAALKRAIKAGQEVEVYDGLFHRDKVENGEATVEGPQYPKAHTYWLRVVVENGVIVKVK